MKKCTNSACRHMFNPGLGECPHCGKAYPRVNADLNVWRIHGRRYGVTEVLKHIREGKKLLAIKALREIVGRDELGLKEAKDLVEARWPKTALR